MKIKILAGTLLILFNTSCRINAERPEPPSDTATVFDKVAATIIIEKRSREFEEAIVEGDSIAVGEIYTMDTKIIPYLSGRDEIVGSAGSMIRNNQTLKLTIKDLWGDENIIIEDGIVEFYDSNGESTSKGDVLLVWKYDGDEWRIFRDVYKPEEE